jgi:hypothetical protein
MVNAVRNACIDFCETTLLWTEWLDRMNVVASQSEYTLSLPAAITHGKIHDVEAVFYKQDGQADDQFTPLDATSEQEKDAEESGAWRFQTSPTPSEYYVNEGKPEVLNLYKIPTAASTSGLLVQVSVKPLITATSIEDFLFYRHRSTIALGALGELLDQKAAPWFDAVLAAKHSAAYRNGRDNAITKKVTGAAKRETRVRMRDWL